MMPGGLERLRRPGRKEPGMTTLKPADRGQVPGVEGERDADDANGDRHDGAVDGLGE